ncbi:MAG: hypothetical protein AB7F35_05010 [Acetobacteraceae bacterium]
MPAVDLGSHALEPHPILLPSTMLPFAAPLALGITPTGKSATPDSDIARSQTVWSDATASAARLHASLVADAQRIAEAARRGAEQRADRRQRDLDQDLYQLASGLEEARNVLNAGAAGALTLLTQQAGSARASIHGAAATARAAIKAAKDRISGEKTTQQEAATKVERDGAAAIDAIKAAGGKAETALQTLHDSPETRFPDGGASMKSAQNERIRLRIPPRAATQKADMHKAAEAQATAMTPMVTKLQSDLGAAFKTFNDWLTELDGPATKAVNSAESGAISQVRKTERTLREAIEAGRLQTEAALVGQHNTARAQLITSSEQRAKQEAEMAEQRATADLTGAKSLAGAPAGTVTAVRDSLDKEKARPPEEFAKVVINAAQSMAPRLDGLVGPQLTALNQRASAALGQLDRQSRDSASRLFTSVVETGGRLTEAAGKTGEALTAQVGGARDGFRKMAAPVGKSADTFVSKVSKNFDVALTKLKTDIKDAGEHLTASLDGKGGGKGGETPPPVTTPGPSEAPNVFKTRAEGIAAAPETETALTGFATTARSKVQTDISDRSSKINTELGSFIHTEENIFANLRQMLPRQATALQDWFNNNYPPTLAGRLRFYFDSSVTTNETWRRNSAAAMAYLSGNAAEGALQEMAASVVLWNDTDRLERVQSSLTPAQMMQLQTLADAPAILADVRGDIDGVDRDVFDALNRVTEDDTSGVGAAAALRLQGRIDTARQTRGYEGGEATYNAIRDANRDAGSRLLSGADALGLDTDQERRDRRERAWTQTLDAFAQLPAVREMPTTGSRTSADALVAYASRERTYAVTTGHGEHAHTEFVQEGVGRDHERLIGNLVRTGEGSAATRAALLVVQMQRTGGRPDVDRLDEATYDADLNPDLASTDPERFQRQQQARERRREMFRLYDLYTRGEDAVRADPRDPDAIQSDLARDVGTRLSSDENRAAYARSMIAEERGDPVAAFTFAVNDWGTNTDVLRRTFGRMTREQVDQAVRDYAAAHDGESLYARLGIHGEGSWFGSELSGEERQQIQVASMGVAQNDLQRAEIAAMEARLQRNEAGWAGRLLAGSEYQALARDYDGLLATMGVSDTDAEGQGHSSFDRLGRLTVRTPDGRPIAVGHFTADGRFEPPPGMAPEALEIAMGQAGISQRAYVAATDRIANAITTTLVVTAAIVTTALTGGAAASIWIPVLVTAGAGLAGMAASAAIKGGRYGRDEMLRDLGTTIVQAATAGLGAAAGVALRGGAPALRAVSSRMLVSEKVLERFMMMGGRGGLRQALTLGEEALIAGGTSAVGGMGQAALDSDAWHRGKWGEGIGNAGMKGFLGGALGSVLMRPVMRAGLPGEGAGPESVGRHMLRRGLGSAVSGTTTRAVEIGYDRAHGHRIGSAEAMSELQLAFVQNFIQGFGEGGAERGSDHVRAVRAETRRAASARARGEGGEPPVRPTATAPEAPAAARPTPEAGGEPAAPRPVAPAAEPGAAPVRPQAAEPVPVPPVLRDTVPEIADAVATGPLRQVAEDVRTAAPPRADEAAPVAPRPTAAEEAAPPAPRGPGVSEETASPAPRRPGAPEEAPPVPRTVANDNDPDADVPTQRRPAVANEEAGGRRRPPPVPEVVDLDKLPEMTVMLDADPTSHQAANDNYGALIRDDPTREVAHYYNPETGVHIVVQGTETTVFVGRNAAGAAEAPGPAGHTQEWKALLDSDAGRWQLLAHFHPGDANGRTGLRGRLPSGESGDFGVVRHESGLQGDVPHQSRIHYLHNGEFGHTDFGYDPHSTTARYWVEMENPVTGRRERHEFPSLEAYGAWVEFTTGVPASRLTAPRDDGGGTAPRTTRADPEAHPPADAAAAARQATTPEHGEITALHGTSSRDLANMEALGIQLGRIEHDHQDFGRALYLTLDDANAAKYGARRVKDLAARGQSATAEAVPFRFRLEDLGVVVDVRPGGQHRAQWEEFLRRTPAAYPPQPEWLPPGMKMPWNTTEEYIMRAGWGIDQRGKAFQAFLEQAGLAHADAVWGDLGGVGTSGLVAEGGGEQIAIRSQALADRLTEQLPGRAAARRAAEGGGEGGTGGEGGGLPPVPRTIEGPEGTPAAPAAKAAAEPSAADLTPAQRAQARTEWDDALDAEFGPHLGGKVPPPLEGEALAAARAAHEAAAAKIDNDAIARFRTQSPAEAAQLDALTTLAPDVVNAAVRDNTERLSPRRAAALREASIRAGNPPDVADAHVQQLRTILERQGGLRDVIAAAREHAQWRQVADDITSLARAAVAAKVDMDVIERRATHKGPVPDALRTMLALEPDLVVAALRAGSPADEAAVIAELRASRIRKGDSDAQADAHVAMLQDVLGPGGMRAEIATARTKAAARAVTADDLGAMILRSRTLLAAAHMDPTQVIDRYVRLLEKAKPKTHQTTEHFEAAWQAFMESNVLSTVSEAHAVFRLAKDMGIDILKADAIGAGRTNAGGIDIVGVVRNPEIGPRPKQVQVVLVDDKAVSAVQLTDVSALTKNLRQNLRSVVDAHEEALRVAREQGAFIHPDHEEAVRQLSQALKDLDALDAGTVGRTPATKEEARQYRHQRGAYADEVAAILTRNGISILVTSELGKLSDLADWLKRYGFRLHR